MSKIVSVHNLCGIVISILYCLVLERLSYYKVRQAGINILNHKVIELLASAKFAMIDLTTSKKALFMRQGVSADNKINAQLVNRIDELFSVVDIVAIGLTEDITSLSKKTKS